MLFVALPFVFSQEGIQFSVAQQEFYFPLHQDVAISINVTNPYNTAISGQFSVTLSQKMPGFMTSSTESKPMMFGPDPEPLGIGLGAAQQPVDMTLSGMRFIYNDPQGKTMIAELPTITIHFVENPPQQQNQQQLTSSIKSQEQENEEAAKKAAEEQKRQQEHIEQQMRQQEMQNQMQNRLQNNQVNPDTQALKQQMQQQMQQQQQKEQSLEEQIEKNEQFQQLEQQLRNEGYERTHERIDAQNTTNGDFQYQYQNAQGKKAEIAGTMNNGTLTSLEKKEILSDQELISLLEQDERYKRYNEKLQNNGFVPTQAVVEKQGNQTIVQIPYISSYNETGSVTGFFEQRNLVDVQAEIPKNVGLWLFLTSLLVACTIGFFMLRKPAKESVITMQAQVTPEIHPREQAKKLLKEAEELFSKQDYKEAYAKMGEAMRVFWSWKLQLPVGSSNNNILRTITKQRQKNTQLEAIFEAVDMVEFARDRYENNRFFQLLKQAHDQLNTAYKAKK